MTSKKCLAQSEGSRNINLLPIFSSLKMQVEWSLFSNNEEKMLFLKTLSSLLKNIYKLCTSLFDLYIQLGQTSLNHHSFLLDLGTYQGNRSNLFQQTQRMWCFIHIHYRRNLTWNLISTHSDWIIFWMFHPWTRLLGLPFHSH